VVSVGALLGEDACAPKRVGDDLARAIAAMLCRAKHGQAVACADCSASGRILAAPLARALFTCRQAPAKRGALRTLTATDYAIIGQTFERIEREAGTRAPIRRRA